MEEKYGPMIKFSYVLSSHGMMAGSGSTRTREIEWKKDGTIEMEDRYTGGGTTSTEKYKVKPEIAQKIADYVTDKKLPELSKKDIKLPQVYDCFTSTTINMTFDNSGIGGVPYKRYSLYCGAAGMTFKTIEDDIFKMLKEIEETCECFFREEKKTEQGFPGMMGLGLANPGMMTNQDPGSKLKWTCKCGCTTNTGRFCCECGSPRPA